MATAYNPLFNKEPEKEIVMTKELLEARDIHNHFSQYLEGVEVTLVESKGKVIKQAENKTFNEKCQGKRIKKQVEDLERKFRNMDRLVNEDSEILNNTQQLFVLKDYSEKLAKAFQALEEKIIISKTRIQNQKDEIQQQQQTIRMQNQESIMLHAQLEKQQRQYKKIQQYQKLKSQLESRRSPMNNSQMQSSKNLKQSSCQLPNPNLSQKLKPISKDDNQVKKVELSNIQQLNQRYKELKSQVNEDDSGFLITQQKVEQIDQEKLQEQQRQSIRNVQDYKALHNHLKNYMKQNYQKMETVRKKSTKFFELKKLMLETFELGKKRVLREPLIDQYKVTKPESLVKKTLQQDRANRNIIYDTVKSIIVKKVASEELNSQPSAKPDHIVPYEIFRQFNTDQLVKLIYANQLYYKQLFHTVQIKEKAINLLQLRLKSQNSHFKNSLNNSFDVFQNSSVFNSIIVETC